MMGGITVFFELLSIACTLTLVVIYRSSWQLKMNYLRVCKQRERHITHLERCGRHGSSRGGCLPTIMATSILKDKESGYDRRASRGEDNESRVTP